MENSCRNDMTDAGAPGAARTRILVVDDEKRILQSFSLMLSEHGYALKTAQTAAEALRMVNEQRFDIAFLDHFIGRDRGLDLMRQLAQADPELFFVMMTANGSTDLAVEALKIGASDFITKPFFAADIIRSIEHVGMKRQLARERKEFLTALEQKVAEKTEELNGITFSVLSSLAQAMEKKDIGTFGHSKRVGCYASLIAAELGLDEQERRRIKISSLFHDIGKIGISDFILGKAGPLDRSEIAAVRNHPQAGVDILKPIKQFEPILPGILHHHETFDGRGYPGGLAGENIPLMARVIAVADTYDAIISSRPYRAGADHEKALSEFRAYAGTQFDPRVVEAFLAAGRKHQNFFERLTAYLHGAGNEQGVPPTFLQETLDFPSPM